MRETVEPHAWPEPPDEVQRLAQKFREAFPTKEQDQFLQLFYDGCSEAYYTVAHLDATTLCSQSDTEAGLDPDEEDPVYKLNREITEDKAAFLQMKEDAVRGRSFEDIIIEYDPVASADTMLLPPSNHS